MPDLLWANAIADALVDRVQTHTLRSRRPVRILDSTHVQIDDRRLINFASNNYLGLTHHPRVIAAFESAAKNFGVGSGAAALVTGQSELHAAAEQAIAAWKGTDSAVLLSSGYAANLAVVQALSAVAATSSHRSVRFLIDKLCHASLVDAVRAASDTRVSFRVFPHNHLERLSRLLADADSNQLQVVVTESIFSMDGDAADLAGICALKKDFPFLLVLDEAHGSGVYGPNGSGYAAELGLAKMVDIAIITLSKAIGCSGGAVASSSAFCEALVNFGRSYIFSTSLPPAIAAAVQTSISVMHDEPRRQQRVRKLAAQVRSHFHLRGDCPIIPIMFGNEPAVLKAADTLSSHGSLVVAVRPPTVPKGTSRLRLTISCDHTDEEVQKLIEQVDLMTSR